jgi:hypothetical protein
VFPVRCELNLYILFVFRMDHPVPGGYKYEDLSLQVGGVSRAGTIKYGLESRGTQTRAELRWHPLVEVLCTRASSGATGGAP